MRPRTYGLKHRFAISQGTRSEVDVVEVTVADDGLSGRGESAPSRRVTGVGPGDVADTVEAWWRQEGADGTRRPPARAPFGGLDAALLDLTGRRREVPVHELLDLEAAERPTSVTVSLDEPKAMVDQAQGFVADGFTHLKVKVGEGPRDLERVRALAEALPEATIRVDANGGWDVETAEAVLPELADLDVELVEQPLPSGRDGAVGDLPSDVPIFADESVVLAEDLDDLAAYDGVVVKVDKHGGPRPTLDLIRAARDRGVAVMIGCNVQSSLGIAAAAHLLAAADKADLDGGFLLADDPYDGVPLEDGRVRTPEGPGLGVREAVA